MKFVKLRKAIPAIALSTDTSVLTACANDFGYDQIFKRQIEALCHAGDVVILMSTSGCSTNILNASAAAAHIGALTIALTGPKGLHVPNLAGDDEDEVCEYASTTVKGRGTTAEIQEYHFHWLHRLCEYLDNEHA